MQEFVTSALLTAPFVSVATARGWLDAGHVDLGDGAHRRVMSVHVRWNRPGLAEPEHLLPGTVVVDLDKDLAGLPGPIVGRHPLPDPAGFARRMGALGIDDDAVVVVSDHGPGAIAARFVWMRRVLGMPAALLDGGMAAWLEAGFATQPSPSILPQVTAKVRPWPPHRIADAASVDRCRRDPLAVLLDVRDGDRFRGEQEPLDAVAGHVPGARNRPLATSLASGLLRDSAQLQELHEDAAAAEEVVVSCGSGVTACHTLLVLEQLGIHGRLYPGSWSGWSSDPNRPVATGA